MVIRLSALTSLVLVTATACGSASPTASPAASPTASPVAATATPALSPSPSASPVAQVPSHGCGDPGTTLGTDRTAELAPGTYTIANPPMEFTIPEPTGDMRWFGAADCAGGFAIRWAPGPSEASATGQVAVIVTADSVDVAVAEWTTAAGSYLSRVEPAELGGASGVVFEGVLPTEQGVVSVHGGFNPRGYVAVYVVAVGTQAVVVVINTFVRGSTFVDDARPVVESFVFTQ